MIKEDCRAIVKASESEKCTVSNQEVTPLRSNHSPRQEIAYTQLTQNSSHISTLDPQDSENDIEDDSWGSEFDESSEDETEKVNLSQEEKDNKLNTLIEAQLDQCRPPSKRKQHRSRDSTDRIGKNVSSLLEKFKSKISQITFPVTNPSGQSSSDSTPTSFSSRNVSQISPVFSRSPPVLPSAPLPDSDITSNQISSQLPTSSTATCSSTASASAGEFSSIPHVLHKTNTPDSSPSKRQSLPSPPISSPDSSNVPSSIYPQIFSHLGKIASEVCFPNKSPITPSRKQNQPSITESPGTASSPVLEKELRPPPLPSRPPPSINRIMAKRADPTSDRTASTLAEIISASSGIKKKPDASEIRAVATPVKPSSAVRKNGEAIVIQTVATPVKPPRAVRKNGKATATPSLKVLPTGEKELDSSSTSLAAMRGPLPPPRLPKRIPHITPKLAELAAASNISIQKKNLQSDPDNPSLMRKNEENAMDKENSAILENPPVDDYLPPRKDSTMPSVKKSAETRNSFSNAFQKFSVTEKEKSHSPERPALPEKISGCQRSISLTSLVATSIIGNTTSKMKNLIAAKDPDRRKSSGEQHIIGLRISNPIVIKQGSDVEKMTLNLLPTTYLGTETPSQENLSQRPWYHQVQWKEAERRIVAMKYDGAFLVRPSNRAHEGVPYVLCVNYLGKLFNVHVRCKTDGSYALGTEKSEEKSFSSLDKLIRFYQTTPLKLQLPESDSQSFVRLLVTPPKE